MFKPTKPCSVFASVEHTSSLKEVEDIIKCDKACSTGIPIEIYLNSNFVNKKLKVTINVDSFVKNGHELLRHSVQCANAP
jgi:hypothetical protein